MSELSTIHAPAALRPARFRSGLDLLVLAIVVLALGLAATAITPSTHQAASVASAAKLDARR